MRKVNQPTFRSDLYAVLKDAPMSDLQRAEAQNAMELAEAIVDGVLWAKAKLAAVGSYFLKPSLKH